MHKLSPKINLPLLFILVLLLFNFFGSVAAEKVTTMSLYELRAICALSEVDLETDSLYCTEGVWLYAGRDSIYASLSDTGTNTIFLKKKDKTMKHFLFAYRPYAWQIDDETMKKPAEAMYDLHVPFRRLVHKPFPIKKLQNAEGKLADLVRANEFTVINYWSHGCGPCRAEIPGFNEVKTRLRDEPIRFVACNADSAYLDRDKNLIAIVEVWKSNRTSPPNPNAKKVKVDFNFEHFICAREAFAEVGVVGYPFTYLVNESGIVRALISGGGSSDNMRLYRNIRLVQHTRWLSAEEMQLIL